MSESTRPLRDTQPLLPGLLLFLTELAAWISAPIALWSWSPVAAVVSVVLLIGLPTVFGTPGDKKKPPPVAVPGTVEIGLEILQCVVAAAAAWFAYPLWLAVIVTVIAVLALITQRPRWTILRRMR